MLISHFLKIAIPKQERKFLSQIYDSSKLALSFFLTGCLYEIGRNVITLETSSLLSNLIEISQ